MRGNRNVSALILLLIIVGLLPAGCRLPETTASKLRQIQEFNSQYIAAHLKMDNATVGSFWADDGVSLLPQTPPLVGKVAISNFFDEAVKPLAGYRMETMEIDFRQIQIMDDWAYEWGLEHQVLQPPDGKPQIEGRGNILLILHKDRLDHWKIKQEMWNAAAKAAANDKQ